MKNLFILLVFKEPEQRNIIYLGLFDKIMDILEHTDNLLKYSDVNKTERVYKTSKSFFKIIKVKKGHKKYFLYRL